MVRGVKLLDRFRARHAAPPTDTRPPRRGTWVERPAPSQVPNYVGPASAHDISPTWLQLPTLRSAGWLVNVVGESFHQDNLEMVSGGRTEDGPAITMVTAELVREPENPFDANAVRVDIDGRPCGHLARQEASDYHATLDALAAVGRPATCRAWLTGGWQRGVLDKGSFGVRLDVHPDLDLAERAAMLPFGDGRVSLIGEQHAQEHLEALLAGSDRVEIIAVLGEPAEKIGVWVNAQLVGTLTAKMSERYGPWVREVQEALLPASCEARIIRGPKKIEVFLKLATPGERAPG